MCRDLHGTRHASLEAAGYERIKNRRRTRWLTWLIVGITEIYIELTGKQYTSIYPQGMSDGLTEIYIELFWFRARSND